MAKLVESDLVDVFEALGDVASRPCTRDQLWSWDGNWYTPVGTRAADKPHMVALEEHSHVLVVLIRMAPFGSYTSDRGCWTCYGAWTSAIASFPHVSSHRATASVSGLQQGSGN